MQSPDIEAKRTELKKLYRQTALMNKRKKELEVALLRREERTGRKERIARRRTRWSDPLLSITTISLITGFSRDKVYRLLRDKELTDRHPVSVGNLIRSGAGFKAVPRRHLEIYQQWQEDWNAAKAKRHRSDSKIENCDNKGRNPVARSNG